MPDTNYQPDQLEIELATAQAKIIERDNLLHSVASQVSLISFRHMSHTEHGVARLLQKGGYLWKHNNLYVASFTVERLARDEGIPIEAMKIRLADNDKEIEK